MSGHNLDVVQEPRMVVTISYQLANHRRSRRGRRMVPKNLGCPENQHCSVREVCVSTCLDLFSAPILSLLNIGVKLGNDNIVKFFFSFC